MRNQRYYNLRETAYENSICQRSDIGWERGFGSGQGNDSHNKRRTH